MSEYLVRADELSIQNGDDTATLKAEGLAGVGDRYIGADAEGRLKPMPDPGGGGGGGVWGSITGTLSAQTDLQSALNAKVPTSRTLTINGVIFDLSANRSWTVSGGSSDHLATVSANTTVSSNNVLLVNTASGNITITITPASFYSSGVATPVRVMKITSDFNTVIITPSSGTINGASTYTLTGTYESVTIYSNGTNLFIL